MRYIIASFSINTFSSFVKCYISLICILSADKWKTVPTEGYSDLASDLTTKGTKALNLVIDNVSNAFSDIKKHTYFQYKLIKFLII